MHFDQLMSVLQPKNPKSTSMITASGTFYFYKAHLSQGDGDTSSRVQIMRNSPENLHNLNLTKKIWTRPKQFGPIQSNLDGPDKTYVNDKLNNAE